MRPSLYLFVISTLYVLIEYGLCSEDCKSISCLHCLSVCLSVCLSTCQSSPLYSHRVWAVQVIEDMLRGLKVDWLVVPSVKSLVGMWMHKFCFHDLTSGESEALEDRIVTPDTASATMVKKRIHRCVCDPLNAAQARASARCRQPACHYLPLMLMHGPSFLHQHEWFIPSYIQCLPFQQLCFMDSGSDFSWLRSQQRFACSFGLCGHNSWPSQTIKMCPSWHLPNAPCEHQAYAWFSAPPLLCCCKTCIMLECCNVQHQLPCFLHLMCLKGGKHMQECC